MQLTIKDIGARTGMGLTETDLRTLGMAPRGGGAVDIEMNGKTLKVSVWRASNDDLNDAEAIISLGTIQYFNGRIGKTLTIRKVLREGPIS